MAIDCLLIDTLKPVLVRQQEVLQALFKRYVAEKIPDLAANLPTPINQPNGAQLTTLLTFCTLASGAGFSTKRTCLSSAVWLVSEANCAMWTQTSALGIKTTAFARPCEWDPTAIFSKLKSLFHEYMNELLDPHRSKNQLRSKFKKKFKQSFGIDLSRSQL